MKVATVSDRRRDCRHRRLVEGRESPRDGPGNEADYPIVVLQNGNSATPANPLRRLKNLDRAVIVGQQSFGKGSVQLVFSEVTPEKAALKLTIAQYLTPGDVSIQGVGVTPDIELDPMTVDTLEMDLSVQKDSVRERELFASLESQYAAPPGKPDDVVRYQFSSADREMQRELGADADDEVAVDFPIRFGRELATVMPAGKNRAEQIKAASSWSRGEARRLAKVAGELDRSASTGPHRRRPSTREDGQRRTRVEGRDHREKDTASAGTPSRKAP